VKFYIAVYLFSKLYKSRIEEEIGNKVKMEQYEERCMKLESASEEIKQKYDRLFSNSGKLEESNKVLSKSIAEFYTLNQISQAIGSILDIKELLKRLNDIILGVMGVSFSTIILYDENTNRLKVHTTNISNINELATLTDNVNSGVLVEALNKGQSILENNVDYFQYLFTCGRNINSLMCIPLITSSRKFGLVLVEHTISNAFDEENVRFLSIITQQVGIVMENAELYYQMKEVARRDGLTGVYNRQYFQERLETEFKEAKKDNYPLSLAIFDIDHFKKFNDTYGHLFGDKVLISTVDVVKTALRKNDMIARFGGEEFIILFPRTNLSDAFEKVEILRKKVSENIIEDNLINASVTASFGISSFDECAFNENDLIRTADDALYDAKAAGRNCVMTAKRLYDY
jgi:diguanylate cyclase (GGDEF)-like protein